MDMLLGDQELLVVEKGYELRQVTAQENGNRLLKRIDAELVRLHCILEDPCCIGLYLEFIRSKAANLLARRDRLLAIINRAKGWNLTRTEGPTAETAVKRREASLVDQWEAQRYITHEQARAASEIHETFQVACRASLAKIGCPDRSGGAQAYHEPTWRDREAILHGYYLEYSREVEKLYGKGTFGDILDVINEGRSAMTYDFFGRLMDRYWRERPTESEIEQANASAMYDRAGNRIEE